MSTTLLSLLILLFFTHSHSSPSPSPYLAPSIFHPNFQKMLSSFKIYTYTVPLSSSTSPLESLFFASLQTSPFLTQDPNQAHLFFLPFPSSLPPRSLARAVRDLRTDLPFWNRTLGADHFYVSFSGIGFESDRNLVELKKNSVQISLFPAPEGRFIPHKDITFPPLAKIHTPHAPGNRTVWHFGYVMFNAFEDQSTLVNELRKESDFLVESEPSDGTTLVERLSKSEFCLFEHGGEFSGLGHALTFGCVPVVITDRPMQDLPLMDVVRWQEIAVFVGSGGGAKGLRSVLERTCRDGACERMRKLGGEVGPHFVWNESPKEYDAFNMIMYQLWLRRHTIRYARRDWM